MKLQCLKCRQVLRNIITLEKHQCDGTQSFSCKHSGGGSRVFKSKESALQHLLTSSYHEPPIPSTKSIKPPTNSAATTRWFVIEPSERALVLAMLKAKVHTNDTLSKYGYPTSESTRQPNRRATPAVAQEGSRRDAVALDCEMVATTHNKNELARLTAVDFLTGEILIDTLINPEHQVTDWRTDVTGITSAAMSSAVSSGKALCDWTACRLELWKYVDSNSILIGHSLNNDLKALRITHTTIVDSLILTSLALNCGPKRLGLAGLCSELPKVEIRVAGTIHDSLEDAFAAREIVLWCLNHPTELDEWASKKKIALAPKAVKRHRNQRQNNLYSSRREADYDIDYEIDYDERDEVLFWSDIAVDFGWPHPDTGYDPWSD